MSKLEVYKNSLRKVINQGGNNELIQEFAFFAADFLICLTAMEKISNQRAMIILADDESHVAHFMKPIDDAFKELGSPNE